jgi:uncharacterized protein (UPF0128 family)
MAEVNNIQSPWKAETNLEELYALDKFGTPHRGLTDGPGAYFLDKVVETSRVGIGKLDGDVLGKLKTLKEQPGNIALMIELQMEVGKRSLMISTTTGALKTAKDDAATVARAI